NPAGSGRSQRAVQLDQRFALQGIGVVAGRIPVGAAAAAGRDDALLLRVSNDRPFGFLEIAAGLVDLPLEEVAGVGRSFVSPLKRGVDEAVRDAVGDQR